MADFSVSLAANDCSPLALRLPLNQGRKFQLGPPLLFGASHVMPVAIDRTNPPLKTSASTFSYFATFPPIAVPALNTAPRNHYRSIAAFRIDPAPITSRSV
jgi:hypothetical protein